MIKIGLTDYTPENKIIDVRDKNQVIKAKYAIGKDDILKYTLMNEHYIEISFELNRNATFKRSDYIEWEGEKYTLREDYQPEQVNKRKYKYTLKFEAIEMFFQDIQYYYLNQGLKESEWRLTGNPEYFIKIAVDNVNRYFGTTDFKVGTIEPTEIKDITFEVNTNTFNALTQVADDYGAEWYITGKTIHLLNKVSFGDEVDFETEVSVLSMKREKGEGGMGYTRIVALGSTRNIPNDYRGSSNNEAVDAIYPKRLRIPTSKGDVIDAYPNMSPNEVVEGTVIFDEVYPKRVGTIEAVGTIEYQDVNEDTGEVTKWNAYKFKDSGINFKEEYMLPGQELKLQFVSGDLNGRDFALKFHPKGFSSSDNSQFFEIYRTDEFGKLLPNDVMKPKAGDKYVLYGFNIALVSDQYVPAGEKELYDVAMEWQKKQLRDTSVYECPTVIKHFMDNQMDLAIGQKVRLIKDVGSNRNFARNFKSWNKAGNVSIEFLNNDDNIVRLTNNSDTSNGSFTSNTITRKGDFIISLGVVVNGATRMYIDTRANVVKSSHEQYRDGITFNLPAGFNARIDLYCNAPTRITNNWYCGIYADSPTKSCIFSYPVFSFSNKVIDWTPSPEDVENAIRSSRIMGFEKKLNNKFDAIYTVGDNSTYSRFGKIEQQIKELQVAGVVYESTGNGGVYVIKQFDSTRPTDFNVYSAQASDAKYFNKKLGGAIEGETLFLKDVKHQGKVITDVIQNSTFTAGQLGSGYQIKRDSNGQSYMEIDNLLVRREAVFNRLTIAEIKSVGGTILLSLASMLLSKVEVKASTWKCFFDTDKGTIPNDFAIGDQAICRKFTGANIKYYWARVMAVGSDYIELSRTDKDGSGMPAIGDEVVQLGNRTDVNRQYAIMLSAYGSDAPSINQYAGINSYDLTGKEVTTISPKGNSFTGSFTISSHGTSTPIYKPRGIFANGTTYYLNDEVSHLGSLWVCIVNSTITTPSEGSTTWRKQTAGQSDIDKAANQVRTEYKADFVVLDTKIASKVSQTDFNALGQRVSTSESNIIQLSNSITSVVETVDNISTNSRNYTRNFKSWNKAGNVSIEFLNDDDNIVRLTNNSDTSNGSFTSNQITRKGDFIISLGVVVNGATKMYIDTRASVVKSSHEQYRDGIAFNLPAGFNARIDLYCNAPTAITNNWYCGIYPDSPTKSCTFSYPQLIKANKYNDWTSAPEDVKIGIDNAQKQADKAKVDADNAKIIADNAQIDASKANKEIADIANDNIITPSEKPNVSQEMQIIRSEKPIIISQATKASVSYTNYENAFNTLNNYITPLLVDWTTSSEIVGGVFRANFKNYYDAKVTLLKDISDKLKNDADNAQNTANTKNRTYYQDQQPTAPSGGFRVGDLWYKNTLVSSSGEVSADPTKNIYQLQFRWNGSTWTPINWSASKSKIEQTDSSISMIVEKTGINSVGTGSSLYSMILQTENEIKLEVGKIQVGNRNYARNFKSWNKAGNVSIEFLNDDDNIVRLTNNSDTSNGSFTSNQITRKGDFIISLGVVVNGATKMYIDTRASVVKSSHEQYRDGIAFNLPAGFNARIDLYCNAPTTITNNWYCGIYSDSPTKSCTFSYPVFLMGNKLMGWIPAIEDIQGAIDEKTTLDEVSSSLTITDNKISLASKTIELTGHTIAKSIEAEDLKVGSRTGLSALEVLKDGTFYAKGSTGGNSELIIDSGTQSIKITSPKSASGEGSPISGSSNVTISSQSGGVRVDGSTVISSNSATIVSNSGIFANTAGQSVSWAGSTISESRASIAGLGWGKVSFDEYYGRDNFVAGVYGAASNSGNAPAYGGYFQMLRANGFVMSMIDISDSTDQYTSLYKSTSFVLGNSSVMQTVYLPSDAYKGTVIWLKQWWTGYMRIRVRGTQRLFDDSSQNDYIDVGEGWTAMCVFIGEWGSGTARYGTWLVSKFKF